MANRYWVGGTAAWDSTAGTKWALTSGGTGGEAVPTTADDVFFDAASGANTVTISAGNTGAKSIDCTGFTGTITGTAAITVAGSITKVEAMTWSHTGKVTITGSGTLINAGKSFGGGLDINGTGITVQLGDAYPGATMELISGTFTTNNYNVTCPEFRVGGTETKVINAGSSTISVSSAGGAIGFGDTLNPYLTFNAGTSQINLISQSIYLQGGGQTFYNVSFTSTGTGVRVINGPNTFNNLTITAPNSAGFAAVEFNSNQTINGTLTCAGATAIRRCFLRSDTLGTARTISAASISANDCDFRDIAISGAASPISPTRAGNCGGNVNITFPAAKTVYWNLSGTQNWSATAWATSSGGTPALNNFPLAQDTAIFDNSGSAGTVSIERFNLGSIDMSTRTTAFTFRYTTSTDLYGSITFFSNLIYTTPSNMTFVGRGTQTITSNGISFGSIIVNCVGTVELGDAYTSTGAITLTTGTFNANNKNVTCSSFSSSNSNTRTLTMGSGTWTLSGTGTIWGLGTTTGLTFNKDTANIVLSDTSTTARTFGGGGLTYNNLTIGGTTGTSTLTIVGANTFNTLASTKTVAHAITFPNETTTVSNWTITGTSGNVVTLSRTGASGTFTLAKSGGGKITNIDYLSISNSVASPANTWYAGANSTNGGSNTNWLFKFNNQLLKKITGNITSNKVANAVYSTTPISNYVTQNSVLSQASYPNLYNAIGLIDDGFDNWTLSSPHGDATNTIIYDNGLYVLGGKGTNGGVIFTSTDAVTWTQRTSGLSGTQDNINSLVYANGLYVYVGDSDGTSGALRTSTDAITWTARTSRCSTTINSITYGNGKYVYVSDWGGAGTSTDAVTWSMIGSGTTSTIYSLTYGNGKYVYGGQNAYGVSTDGITWSVTYSGGSFPAAEYGNGVYLLANGQGLDTSEDAVTWTSRTINFSTNLVKALTYGNGIYLVAGQGGALASSANGTTWTTRTNNFNADTTHTTTIYSLAYGNGVYVYGAYGGIVATSTNATTWSVIGSGGTSVIWAMTYGNGVYAYGDQDGNIATSTNGTSWTSRTTVGTNKSIQAAAYGNGVFVMAGDGGGVFTAGTTGTAWTSRTSGITTTIWSLTYGNGLFVYGGHGGALRTSADGITWTSRTSGTTSSILALLYNSGLYVYGGAGGVLATSTDAITWTARTSGTTSSIRALTYGNGIYIYGAGTDGFVNGNYATSTDAITWTAYATSGDETNPTDLIYNSGIFVSAGRDGAYTSTNGTSWTNRLGIAVRSLTYGIGTYLLGGLNGLVATSTNATTWSVIGSKNVREVTSIVYGNGIFSMIGNGVDSGSVFDVHTSTNGVTWTARASSASPPIVLAYGNGLWLHSVESAPNQLLTSTDAISWTNRAAITGTYIRALTYGNGLYLYGADRGQLHTSTNGITWTNNQSGTGVTDTININVITYGDGIYVYGGAAGALRTSTDGITWTARTSGVGTGSAINTLLYNNGLYVYGAVAGLLATSTDAITWTARTSGTTSGIFALTYGDGTYLYGGAAGTLRSSTDAITWSARISGSTLSILALAYANGKYIYGDASTSGNLGVAVKYTYNSSTEFITPPGSRSLTNEISSDYYIKPI